MKPFGLQRGIVGSTAKHQVNSEYYRQQVIQYEEDIAKLQADVEKAQEGRSTILAWFGKGDLSKAKKELADKNRLIAELNKQIEELQAEKARLQEQHKSEIGKLRNGYQKEIDKAIHQAEAAERQFKEKDAIIDRQRKQISLLDRKANPQRYSLSSGAELVRVNVSNYRNPSLHIWTRVGDELFDNIKFQIDAIIGNPPYQVVDGGGNGAAAIPIYNKFVCTAKDMHPHYISMIMPAKWYGGGRGLDDFRKMMLNETHIDYIKDFPNPKSVFPTANISGGVCFFRWSKTHNSNIALFINAFDGTTIESKRQLNEFLQYDIFPRYNEAVAILHKVISSNGFESLSKIVAQYKPFGLRTYIRGTENKQNETDVLVHSSGGCGFISRQEIPVSLDYIDKYNVITGKALSGHLGESDENGQVKVLATTKIILPGEVCTESYIAMGKFDTEFEAYNLYKYLCTKVSRFLLLQALPTMDIRKESFRFVPLQDFTDSSDIDWSKPIEDIDRQLYRKYGLHDEKIGFIERMIKPME